PENGFHVARALVGTEGTCVVVLEATVRLVHSPPARVLLVLGYPDVADAADDVPRVLESRPIGLQGLDAGIVGVMRRKGLHVEDTLLLPEGRGWLLVEFGGETEAEAMQSARHLMSLLERGPRSPSMRLFEGKEQRRIWIVRESALGATAIVPGQPPTWEG